MADVSIDLKLNGVKVVSAQIQTLDKMAKDFQQTIKLSSEQFGKLNNGLGSIEKNLAKLVKITSDLASTFKKSSFVQKEIIKNSENISNTVNKTTDANEKMNASFADTSSIFSKIDFSNFETELNSIAQLIITVVGGLTTGKFLKGFSDISTLQGQLTGAIKATGKTLLSYNSSLFGIIGNLGVLSVALISLGQAFKSSDSTINKTLGSLLTFGGVLSGFASFALGKAVISTGKLTESIGDKLLTASRESTEEFIKAEAVTFNFTRTIQSLNRVYGPVIGSTEFWNKSIGKLSDTTGVLESDLQAAAQEIITVGAKLGLSRDQSEKLLKATVNLGRSFKKDIINTSVNVVQGLAGNTSGLIKFGVKLSETTLEQKLLSKGIKRTVSSLSEAEKVQLRYNALLDQTKIFTGAAAAQSNNLAGQQDILNNNVKQLTQSFGSGASVIEGFQIKAFLVNKAFTLINPKFVAATGFLSALAGNVLKVIGIFLQFSLVIFGVIKGLNLLNVLLNTQLATSLFFKQLPLFNFTIAQFVQSLGLSTKNLRSFQGVFKIFVTGILVQGKSLIAGLLGIKASALTLGTFLKGALSKSLAVVARGISIFGRALFALALNPVVLTIAAITAGIVLLRAAFIAIEERTQVFTTLFGILENAVQGLMDSLGPLGRLFARFGDLIKDVADRAFGLFVAGVSEALSKLVGLARFANKITFGKLFSESTLSQFDESSKKLSNLTEDLVDVGFKFSELEKPANRSIASISKNFTSLSKNVKKQSADVINFINSLEDEILSIGGAAVRDPFGLAVSGLDKLEKKFEQIKPKLTEEQIFRFREQLEIAADVSFAGTLSGFALLITQGAEGAKNLLIQGATKGIESLAPGFGAVAAPLLEAFAGGPEQVRQQVREFAKALPIIAENIILAIPAFVDEIIAQLPFIIERFTAAMIRSAPQIAVGLLGALLPGFGNAGGIIEGAAGIFKNIVGGAGRFIVNAGKQFLNFIGDGGRALIQGLGDAGRAFFDIIIGSGKEFFGLIFDSGLQFFRLIADSGVNFIGEILSGAGRFVEELISSIPIIGDLLGGGGGGIVGGVIGGVTGAVGGIVDSVSDVFGFAEGGLVPNGFNGDTFPARLSSGEFIVNNALTPRLDRFLANQESGSTGGGAMEETLFKIQESLDRPIEAQATVQFNQNTLAEIIINLNRSNRRLS